MKKYLLPSDIRGITEKEILESFDSHDFVIVYNWIKGDSQFPLGRIAKINGKTRSYYSLILKSFFMCGIITKNDLMSKKSYSEETFRRWYPEKLNRIYNKYNANKKNIAIKLDAVERLSQQLLRKMKRGQRRWSRIKSKK